MIKKPFSFFCAALFLLIPFLSFGYESGVVIIDGKHQFRAIICETDEEYARGLGGRTYLEKDQGMLFPYFHDGLKERIFWMKGMQIAIDILWIAEGKIAYIAKSLQPPSIVAKNLPTYGYGLPADAVFEIKAGLSDALQLKVGQKFEVR